MYVDLHEFNDTSCIEISERAFDSSILLFYELMQYYYLFGWDFTVSVFVGEIATLIVRYTLA